MLPTGRETRRSSGQGVYTGVLSGPPALHRLRSVGFVTDARVRNGCRAFASRGLRMTTFVRGGLIACLLLGLGVSAAAQDSPPPADSPAKIAPERSQEDPKAAAARQEPATQPSRMTPPPAGENPPETPAAQPGSTLSPFRALIPNFSGTTITWIAVVLILALLLQTRPLLSWSNLDALALALAALALAFRSETAQVSEGGPTLQAWSYGILTGACV